MYNKYLNDIIDINIKNNCRKIIVLVTIKTITETVATTTTTTTTINNHNFN